MSKNHNTEKQSRSSLLFFSHWLGLTCLFALQDFLFILSFALSLSSYHQRTAWPHKLTWQGLARLRGRDTLQTSATSAWCVHLSNLSSQRIKSRCSWWGRRLEVLSEGLLVSLQPEQWLTHLEGRSIDLGKLQRGFTVAWLIATPALSTLWSIKHAVALTICQARFVLMIWHAEAPFPKVVCDTRHQNAALNSPWYENFLSRNEAVWCWLMVYWYTAWQHRFLYRLNDWKASVKHYSLTKYWFQMWNEKEK